MTACNHSWIHNESVPFANAQRARYCWLCGRFEVLVDGAWVDFDCYVKKTSPPGSTE